MLPQLLDVGTQPLPGSIYKLYDSLQRFPQIGGVCGEIAVRTPRLYNFVEASQHFEYKISHVMDKGATMSLRVVAFMSLCVCLCTCT